MNENKTPAPEGVYNCAFVGASRSTKSNRAMHFVMNVRLRPLDCGVDDTEVCEYFAEVPLCFKVGAEYNFFNRDAKTSETRKATAKDTEAAIQYARKCFPAWSQFVDALPDTASFGDAFAWFDQPHPDVTVRAKIKAVRYYPGTDGVQHASYDATIYEANGGGASLVDDADAFNAEFGKSLKAAGVKFGGGAKAVPAAVSPIQAAARAARAKATPPPAPAAPAAKKPECKTTRDDAWAAYYKSRRFVDDPQGANFDAACDEIIGGDGTAFALPEDWQKCVDVFSSEAV